jgi:antitoxin HigA-1
MKNKEIEIEEIWNDEKNNSLKDFIKSESDKQSKERKLRNAFLAIQFKVEDYITNETPTERLRILDFVKLYLKALNITQKRLAELFEMKDSNLHKYLIGERKLNTGIILKLSSFSQLSPEYWLRIEVKNDLFDISKEKERYADYQKYDYRNLFMVAEN